MGSYLSQKQTSTGGAHRVVVFSSPTCVWCTRANRLFTADEIAAALQAAEPDLIVERAEVVRRVPAPGQGPIDALLVLRRP
jgi:hypothetical protein